LLVPAAESAPGRLLLRFSSHQTTATTTMMTTSQTIQSIAEPFSPYSAHEAWLPMLDGTSGRSWLSSLLTAKAGHPWNPGTARWSGPKRIPTRPGV
jgi:hypothetical protein